MKPTYHSVGGPTDPNDRTGTGPPLQEGRPPFRTMTCCPTLFTLLLGLAHSVAGPYTQLEDARLQLRAGHAERALSLAERVGEAYSEHTFSAHQIGRAHV